MRVLLAAFNGERWIREQIRSVLDQTGVDVELVVADDASTDSTVKVLVEAFGSDPKLTIQRRTEGSGSAGANFRRLIADAQVGAFDFVALCDQDDTWHPGKLVAAIEALGKSGAQGYSCAVKADWPDGSTRHLGQSADQRAADFLFEGAGQGCTMVMTRDFFVRIRDFCLRYPQLCANLHYHDWLVYLLARAWQLPWVFDPRAWIRYRQHGGNEIGARGGLAAFNSRIALARSGWYRRQIAAAGRIYAAAGGSDEAALGLVRHFTGERRAGSRQKTLDLLRHSRRRGLDRAAVVCFAWLRWI